jgi:hypothetical protein
MILEHNENAQNEVHVRIFGAMREAVTRRKRSLHNREVH